MRVLRKALRTGIGSDRDKLSVIKKPAALNEDMVASGRDAQRQP